MPRKNDLTGKRFGKLTVLGKTEERKSRYVVWLCRCDCGNVIKASTKDMARGMASDCGCGKIQNDRAGDDRKNDHGERSREERGGKESNREAGNREGRSAKRKKGRRAVDITGRKFGKLTALYPTERRDGKGSVYWRCRCECGREIDATESGLMHGNYRSCGCLKKEHQRNIYRQLHLVDGTCLEILEKRKHRSDNSSGSQGISVMKNGRFRVDIGFKGKRFYLGTFQNYDSAVAARKEAEELIHEGFIRAYREWTERARSDSDWARENPFIFEVERLNGKFTVYSGEK